LRFEHTVVKMQDVVYMYVMGKLPTRPAS